jgi:signal transduction histidine kinase
MSLVREGAPAFPRGDRDTLLRLAEQASVALSNAVSFRSALRAARVNRAVLDATPDPVGLLDSDGQLVAHNEAMGDVWEQFPEMDIGGGGEERDILELGARSYSRYAGPVRDESGTGMGRLIVLREVTAERESERLKDEFFALVSHELRTPLTSIIGYLELVRDDEETLGDDARHFLEVVDRNAKRLLRLVGDMLFVAQVEAGRLTLERVALDLRQVVADSVEAARPAAERAGVELSLEAEPVGLIDGDRDRVGQLIDNLVSNALKFTAPGGRVLVALRPADGDRALVAVGDDGMGIPDAEQQHLFERFFRSSSASSRAVPGVGLGLTIVKTIVEAHAGEVALESREGVGTIVRVHLPLSQAQPS